METLLLLTYAAICIFIFKVFKVPLNKWTVPTAVLGGIVLVGGLVLFMNYNHPFTDKVRQVYVVTPLVSEVRARVLVVDKNPFNPSIVLGVGKNFTCSEGRTRSDSTLISFSA